MAAKSRSGSTGFSRRGSSRRCAGRRYAVAVSADEDHRLALPSRRRRHGLDVLAAQVDVEQDQVERHALDEVERTRHVGSHAGDVTPEAFEQIA